MRRDTAQDDRLSWEARGLLAYLLSKADNWKVRLGDLRREGGAGRDQVRRILKELETARYMMRERVRIGRGRFDWICTVFEKPQAGINSNSPCPEKPATAQPPAVEPSTVNRSIYKPETGHSRERQNTEHKEERDVVRLSPSLPTQTHGDAASPRVRERESRNPRQKKAPINLSRYTKTQIRRYVDNMANARNPGGLTHSLWLSGDADADVAEYLQSDSEWQKTAPQEGVRMLYGLLGIDKPPKKWKAWEDCIRAHVVTEFDAWRIAVEEAAAKEGVFYVDAAIDRYCDLVTAARQSMIDSAA